MVRGNHHRLAITVPGSAVRSYLSQLIYSSQSSQPTRCANLIQNKLSNILTHSMLISWLRQNEHLFGSLRSMLVSGRPNTPAPMPAYSEKFMAPDIADMVEENTMGCTVVKETEKANTFTHTAHTHTHVINTRTYTHTHAHTRTHIHTYMHAHTCMHTYACTYIGHQRLQHDGQRKDLWPRSKFAHL
jgi:hypothetical protein